MFLTAPPFMAVRPLVKVDLLISGSLPFGPAGTMTWAGVPFGAPAPDRELVIAWVAARSGAGMNLNSATIGGQPVTPHRSLYANGSSYWQRLGVSSVQDLTAATTGTVQFVFSAGVAMYAALYRVTGLQSRIPTDAQDGSLNGTGNLSVPLGVQAGGAAFASFFTLATVPTVTVTHGGVGIDYTLAANPQVQSMGHQTSTINDTLNLTAISVGPGASKYSQRLVAASFR